MTSLSLVAVLGLAAAHAPQVAPETIVAFAHTESRMNPLAIYDNTSKESYAPGTAAAAAALAKTLLDKGHSIDVGLMQINSQNFRLTGLDAVSAFDPAQSIRAAAMILAEAYLRCVSQGLSADPLRCMASIYNTGNHRRGEANGYVPRIYAAAEMLVPAIREAVGRQPAPTSPTQSPAAPPHGCGPPPPSWDGWARAAYQRCLRKPQASSSKSESKENEVP